MCLYKKEKGDGKGKGEGEEDWAETQSCAETEPTMKSQKKNNHRNYGDSGD